ncbi:MAG: winged helix-turn-helix domain-containing protein [Pyrinomonadaceae bacterium]
MMAEITTGTSIYEFDGYSLIPSERLLKYNGEPVSLSPKVFDVLVILVESNGHLIEKDELLDRLWPDTFVEEATLARTISRLRKALGEDSENRYIKTVAKSGYRFAAPVDHLIVDELDLSDDQTGSRSDKGEKKSAPDEDDEFLDLVSDSEAANDPVGTNKWSRKAWRWSVVFGALLVLIVASAYFWPPRQPPVNETAAVDSIVVLPFNVISEGEEDPAFELGMANALIIKLSNVKQIVVRPTSAVFKYAGQNPDPAAVGRELKVDAALEGNIQKYGERLRISVRLVKSSDGASLWAENFDVNAADIFDLQDKISAQITEALKIELTGAEKESLAKRYTDNAEAFQAYSKGRYLWNKRTPADFKKSLGFYQRAIEIDPNYALAYAGMADCYQLFAEYRLMPVDDGFAKARAAARKALEIDDSLAEAHASLGYTLAFYDWNWTAAEKEFKRAIELKPTYATARQWYSEYLTVTGRFEEVRIQIKEAERLDPSSLIIGTDVASYYYLTKQYDKAIEQSQKILELEPDFAWGHTFLYLGYTGKKMEKEAIESLIKVAELFYGSKPEEIEELKKAYQTGGSRAFWTKRLEQMDRPENQHIYLAWDRVGCYLWLGDDEKVIDWLEKSYQNRDRWIINIKYEPQFEHLHSRPRFQEIVNRLGLENR